MVTLDNKSEQFGTVDRYQDTEFLSVVCPDPDVVSDLSLSVRCSQSTYFSKSSEPYYYLRILWNNSTNKKDERHWQE